MLSMVAISSGIRKVRGSHGCGIWKSIEDIYFWGDFWYGSFLVKGEFFRIFLIAFESHSYMGENSE